MTPDYGAAAGALIGALAALVVIVAVTVRWATSERKSRTRIVKVARMAAMGAIIAMLYFGLFDHTSRGTECQKSTSPNGFYKAERCLLDWIPGGSSRYVGRVFDAKNGKLLAQHTFSTPVPDLSWSSGVLYSLDPDGPLRYFGATVGFSKGDGGDDSTYISLPPSRWERLLAARPRL
ncbi:hypothetical protein BCh11DRAFT_01656 [Burkholderia sp. Ch1-1]|nr:hypothetical protein BCh11DRAFT_01656 [Burkholderia sp. Ch1-1]